MDSSFGHALRMHRASRTAKLFREVFESGRPLTFVRTARSPRCGLAPGRAADPNASNISYIRGFFSGGPSPPQAAFFRGLFFNRKSSLKSLFN
jgi:hypothetical protein